MRTRKVAANLLVIFTLLGFLGTSRPAAAQLMSKWGHPVFTIGETPYDSINTGHGNYPGGPGFIPGYGYYPGVVGPGHYPWMDGPGVPFDRRTIAPEFPTMPADGRPAAMPSPEAPASPDTALVIVKLPAEAELWIDGIKTTQEGSYRRFATPPLPTGRPLRYTLRVRWQVKDAELSRVEEVQVAPGGTFTVNFLTTDSWTGKRLESMMLPAPRQR